ANTRCRADYGLLAVRMGRTEEGLARLRQAAMQNPDDPGVVGKLAKGLRLAGQGEEARRELRAALFRNPRVPRFHQLWAEYQLDTRRRREAARAERAGGEGEGPVLLPFVRVEPSAPAADAQATILRADGGRDPRRFDQRNVQ